MTSWMEWVQAMPEEILQGVLKHPETAAFQARKRALAEKKVFEEVFGDWQPKEMPYLVSIRLKLTELDARLKK